MTPPKNKKAPHNIIDNMDKKTLKKIISLREKDRLSYAKIAAEMNMPPGRIFKIIEKHLGKQKKGAHKGNEYAKKWHDPKKNKLNVTMDELIEDLLDYCENSKSIHLAPWCRSHGFSKNWLLDTAKHYPELDYALTEAKELLSSKIANRSFWDKENGTNASFGVQYLPIYDKEFRELLKWKAEIAREQQKAPENQAPFNAWKDEQKNK